MSTVTRTTPAVIVDIDGTIRDTSEIIHLVTERPKDYDEFYRRCSDCPPIERIVNVLRERYFNPGWKIVIASGQPERYRLENERYVNSQLGRFDWMCLRQAGDRRKAPEVKYDMLLRMRAYGYHPIDAWDDDLDVVRMYIANGIAAHHVDNPSWNGAK